MLESTLVLNKKKNKMKQLLLMAFLVFSISGFSQDKQPKTAITKFKTSAVCGSCKSRIEDKLNYTKGIIYAELDDDTKVVTVKYKTKVLNPEKIKYLVAQVGYDAGETPRDPEAFAKLPGCCQSAGHCSH